MHNDMNDPSIEVEPLSLPWWAIYIVSFDPQEILANNINMGDRTGRFTVRENVYKIVQGYAITLFITRLACDTLSSSFNHGIEL